MNGIRGARKVPASAVGLLTIECTVHDLFSVRNMFFFALRVLAGASTSLGAGLCDESEERFQEVLRTAGKQKPKEPASEKTTKRRSTTSN